MIRVFSSAAIAAIVAASTAAQAVPFNDPSDVQAITAIETEVAVATDIDKVMPYYAPDAVVADFGAPGWYEGPQQIKAAFQPQLAAVKSIKFHMDDINIASDGKFACAAMQMHFDTTLQDGKPLSMTIRELDAFKKLDGHWRFIEQHVSIPVDEKTGAGVFNGPLPVRGKLTWAADPLPGPAEPADQAKADIRKWVEAEALPTAIDDAMTFYGPGDDAILFETFSPGEHRGLKEIRDYFGPALAGLKSVQAKFPAFFDDSDGVFGVQIDRQDLKLAMKDGKTEYMSFRQSDCMRRVGDKWHAFFEMGSFPVDPKTGKATMANPAAFQ